MPNMNRHILIADDDKAQLRLFRKMLMPSLSSDDNLLSEDHTSFILRLFNDGVPLVHFFKNEYECGRRIPLCILDMCMISMNGLETAKALRAIDPGVFIIIITSYEGISHKDLINSLKKEVYFLNKPIQKEEFLALVTSLVISWNNQQELHLAYQKLNLAHHQLEILIENTPIAVAMLDNRMRYLACSRRWLAHLGLERNELMGVYHYDVVTDVPDHWKEEHKRCLAGEVIKRTEEKFERADGSVEYIRRELYPFKDSGGTIGGIIIFIDFITEKVLAEKARQEAEEKIRENEAYLKAIMSAIQTSVMIIDPKDFKIMDANPYTLEMLQCGKEDIIGKDLYEFRADEDTDCDSNSRVVSNEYALRTRKDEIIYVRRSVKETGVRKKTYLVQSLLDITDIRHFMKKQEISIELAKYLLRMINRIPPRYTYLTKQMSLFFDAIYLPCFKEGGDHYFVRTMQGEKKRTLISLKDQSGHYVGCIIRSIITDLTHHTILNQFPDSPIEDIITILNNKIYHLNVFKAQDFFTSADVAIDHETLDMSYISAGHPRFFLIRGNDISGLPEHGSAGRNLPIPVLSDMRYSAGTCRLQAGDKLIFYSDGLNDLFGMKKDGSFTYHALKSSVQEIIDQSPAISVSELMRILSEKANLLSVSPNTLPDDITILGVEIEDDDAQNEVILTPAALPDSIFALHLRLFKELKQREFDISDFGLRSVLAESIINAWIHGNRRNPDKTIIIRWRHGNDFHLAIHDQGEGFDYQRISDPKSGENITKESGRGLYIIRRFSDVVRWENGGRSVIIIIKKRHDAADQAEQRRTETLIRLW